MPTHAQKLSRLYEAVRSAEASYELAKAAAAQRRTTAPVRHKCFITYHGADIDAVTTFVEAFNDVFIPRVVGVSQSDEFKDPISSDDEDYIKSQIGAKYLSDSTVTILYVGNCTWSRKFVDWELSSTLRNDPVNKRNGLLAITPADRQTFTVPERFADNWDAAGSRYARWYYYPSSGSELRGCIQDAFDARSSRAETIVNSRKLRTYDSLC